MAKKFLTRSTDPYPTGKKVGEPNDGRVTEYCVTKKNIDAVDMATAPHEKSEINIRVAKG